MNIQQVLARFVFKTLVAFIVRRLENIMTDPKRQRALLEELYHTYIQLIHSRGIPFKEPENVLEMDDFDLSNLVAELKDVVRTPVAR